MFLAFSDGFGIGSAPLYVVSAWKFHGDVGLSDIALKRA